VIGSSMLVLVFAYGPAASAQTIRDSEGDEGTRIFKATEHPHYSGQFQPFRSEGDFDREHE